MRTGFTDVVITTAHIESLRDFFSALGWTCRGELLSSDEVAFWSLDAPPSRAARMRLPSGSCTVTLIDVSPETPLARPLTMPVTAPGGLFDINMRTCDSDWSRQFLLDYGWRVLVEPVAWQFGDVLTKEGLFIQDDGVVLAVMERLHPPLDHVGFDRMSDIFNATQMVTSAEDTARFLAALGFRVFIDHLGPLPGEGANVLQLEHVPEEEGAIRLLILHPDAAMDGSIELIETLQTAQLPIDPPTAPARGLTALAIPHANIEALFARLLASEWFDQIEQPLAERALWGREAVPSFSVRAPDGGRLDLYQCDK